MYWQLGADILQTVVIIGVTVYDGLKSEIPGFWNGFGLSHIFKKCSHHFKPPCALDDTSTEQGVNTCAIAPTILCPTR